MLFTLTVLLAAAVLLVPLSRRLGLGSVLGYLVGGALIGPSGLRLVTDVHAIADVSELGVVMLLFLIGLEVQPQRLWVMRRAVFGLGSAQVVATAAALAGLLAVGGVAPPAAVVLGAGLALSSTAIVLPMLGERDLLGTPAGRSTFSVLLFQDLAFVPLVAAVPLLAAPLLTSADPPPFTIVNPGGASPFLLIGDHAGNVIPSALGTLGLPDTDRVRHIAWDIGIAGLGEALAARLDAAFVRQTYSRLGVDSNRAPDAPDAVAPTSDGSPVPGNHDLSPAERQARFDEVHEPYQQAIGATIAARGAAGRETILVALHSFTPALKDGLARPWQVGVLHHLGEPAFAPALIAALAEDGALCVGDNEPYRMDLIDYTVPRHAWPARLPYAEIEVRQDLIGEPAGQIEWADRLADALVRARETLPSPRT